MTIGREQQGALGATFDIPLIRQGGLGGVSNNDIIARSLPIGEPCKIESFLMKVRALPAVGDALACQVYRIRPGVSRTALFSAAQSFPHADDPTAMLVKVNTAGAWATYLTEVTGTGHAQLDLVDDADAGGQVAIGGATPYDAIIVTMVGGELNDGDDALTVKYADYSDGWTSASATDGTDSTGTLRQNGTISWNKKIMDLWQKRSVNGSTQQYFTQLTHDGAGAGNDTLANPTSIDTIKLRRLTDEPYAYTPNTAGIYCREGDLISVVATTVESVATLEEITMTARCRPFRDMGPGV